MKHFWPVKGLFDILITGAGGCALVQYMADSVLSNAVPAVTITCGMSENVRRRGIILGLSEWNDSDYFGSVKASAMRRSTNITRC